MTQAEMDVRRKKIEKWTKVGLLGVAVVAVLGVAAPLLIAGVKAAFALGAAGLAGFVVINVAPTVAMKVANWRLKSIKAEASKNPIETLQNVYVEKTEALGRFEDAITAFATKVKNLQDKVEGLRKRYPEEAEKFEGHLEKMTEVLQARRRKYKAAKQAISDFAEEIEKAKVVWEVSQAAQDVTNAAGLDTGDAYELIKAKTAVESVQNSMNTAIAELETDLMNEEADLEHEMRHQQALPPAQPRLKVAAYVEQDEKAKVTR